MIHGDRRQSFFISYGIAVVALVLAAGSYIYRGIAADWALEPHLPQSYSRLLVRECQQYHRVRKAYPASFEQLREVSQPLKNAKWVRKDETRIEWHNYRYVLVTLPDDRIALWAFPVGDYRIRGTAFCVIAGVGWARVWARKALTDEGIAALPKLPTMEALTEFRFTEVEQAKLQ